MVLIMSVVIAMNGIIQDMTIIANSVVQKMEGVVDDKL